MFAFFTAWEQRAEGEQHANVPGGGPTHGVWHPIGPKTITAALLATLAPLGRSVRGSGGFFAFIVTPDNLDVS